MPRAILVTRETAEHISEIVSYSSIEALALAVEAHDVAEGIYAAYDETGARYDLVGYVKTSGKWLQSIEQGPVSAIPRAGPRDPAELRTQLIQYLAEQGHSLERLASSSLASLIDVLGPVEA